MSNQNSAENYEPGQGTSSFLEEILGTDVPLLQSPGKREFQPWHRPRKQYVRSDQWLKELSELLASLKVPDTEFRYLSLPGNDFLDIRYIHDNLCVPQGMSLRFLGFNRMAGTNHPQAAHVNTNLSALRRLSHIAQTSHILGDDLRAIGRPNSLPRRTVQSIGAFHAINIDLCDGFAREGAGAPNPNLFDAMKVLIECQSRTINDSLLFVTTRIDSDQVSEVVQLTLHAMLGENMNQCQPFADAVRNYWPSPSEMNAIDSLQHEDRFILGFTKWIISVAVQHRLSVAVKSVFTYRVKGSALVDDLMSIAIRLSPHRAVDRDVYYLANLGDARSEGNLECQLAAKIPARIYHRRSVDDKLQDDTQLHEKCVRESEGLLQSVGYDIAEYRAWLDE
ncbi:MAG: hypothetical protein K1Y02_24850 [Candidatus Hydrogenedentes bacterium]|nr:hypothetical protein [Candidatus Hydrogenedentota bacterium]